MDDYGTLNLLLDSLFTNNCLQNWSLFEEMNGNNCTVVKLRFTKKENSEVTPQSYCRRSEAQSRRDRDRAARHRAGRDDILTRSRASLNVQETVAESVELPRESETISHSDTVPLEHSPVLQLNPGADSFVPDSVNLNKDQCTDLNDSLCGEYTGTGTKELFEDLEPNIDLPHLETKQIRETSSITSDDDANDVSYNEEIRCVDCFTSFRGAVNVYKINMMWCDSCKVNICEQCYDRSRHFYKCKKRVKTYEFRDSRRKPSKAK